MNLPRQERRNRDWILFLAILLLGLVCMLLTGTLAIGLAPQWTVQASMDSKLNPNAQYVELKSTVVIEPVLPAILTPPSWQDIFLTPQNTPTSTPTKGASNPSATPKPSSKPPVKTSTPAASPQVTATAHVTATNTSWIIFPSATPVVMTIIPTHPPVATKTYTPTKSPTGTKTLTSTRTATSTRSATPTITATATVTLTPTITATMTVTDTPTETITPTMSATPTITLTPIDTFTPTITPTVDPINFGPPDGIIDHPGDGAEITYCGLSIQTHGTSDPDFVYYEMAAGSGILMDQVILQISQNISGPWTTVFDWGNGNPDINSNLDISGPLGGSETDNREIDASFLLVGNGRTTGVGVDIDYPPLGLSGSYSCLKIISSGSSGDGIDVDSIEIYP